jgi:molybdenum cofactor cytidylyltransferase
MTVGTLILAAGSSTRFEGQAKQLLVLDGKTLIRRAVETALSAMLNGPVLVVLGANRDQIAAELVGLPVGQIHNPDHGQGMATSLRAGLLALQARQPDLSAVAVMLCDQPLITPDLLRQLVDTQSGTGKPIVACRYAGQVGVPALFAQAYFSALLALDGDKGARFLLKNNKTDLAEVGFEPAAVDLDSWADVEKFTTSRLQRER